jgi:chemotaxis protein MotB
MSESISSLYKTVSWLLAILLIGVTALYRWHGGNQREILARKEARIAESAQLLASTEKELGQLQKTSRILRSEKQKLSEELEVADQARERLQDELKAQKLRHAEALAAEQEKQRQAYAKLEAKHEAANEENAALHENIAQIQAARETEQQQLEQRLNEKIDYYWTALKGSAPERATQLEGLEQQIRDNRQIIEETNQAMQALREKEADLREQLTSASRVIAQRDKRLSEKGEKLKSAQAQLAQVKSALAALQQKHDESIATTQETLGELQHELQATKAAHEKTKTETAAAMQAAKQAHAARIEEAERKVSDLADQLRAEKTAAETLRKEHKTTVAKLQGSLDSIKDRLARVQKELSTTKEAAARAQHTHEQQIATLEKTLQQTRQQAAQDLAVSRRETEQTEARVRGLFTDLSKLGGRHTDRGMLLSLAEEELRFGVSKADLPEGELPSLDRIAELLEKYPNLMARIEGHTDSRGRDETNLALSQKRADAVVQALIDRGVDAERLTAQGIGEARPIADNASWAGRSRNRRVEIYVVEISKSQ